jgi:anti-sigma B factor antagonist
MDAITRTTGKVNILELKGRFDAYELKPVQDWIEKNATGGKPLLVVNLSGVNFLDSSALAVLVKGMKRTRDKGGDLYLCGLQQPVHIIFELTKLDRAFDIYPNEKEAVSAFNG